MPLESAVARAEVEGVELDGAGEGAGGLVVAGGLHEHEAELDEGLGLSEEDL